MQESARGVFVGAIENGGFLVLVIPIDVHWPARSRLAG